MPTLSGYSRLFLAHLRPGTLGRLLSQMNALHSWILQKVRFGAIVVALGAICGLAGCTQLPVETGPVDFRVEGKVGVVEGGRSYSARFVWRQMGERYDVVIWGPFGQGATRFRGDPDRVEVTDRNDRPGLSGEPRRVMRQRLGWSLPLEVLPWWLSGEPAPDGLVEAPERDAQGRLSAFRQLGWQVNYDRFDGPGSQAQPRRITAERPGYRIRLNISSR